MVNRASTGGRSAGQLNFHQLYIFQTVANHLSFSRAAEAMEITQPAVSIQVQELEKFLGVTLFHRRPRGLRITEAGDAVLAYAQQIFSLSNQLVETVQEMEDLQSGRLVLGASTTPGEYVLPMIVGRFRQIYPGIRVELAIGNTRNIVQRILDREMDLGMVGDRVEEHSDELEMVDFQDDEIVFVAEPGHEAASLAQPRIEQIVELGLIAREEGSATRLAAERQFRALGIEASIASSSECSWRRTLPPSLSKNTAPIGRSPDTSNRWPRPWLRSKASRLKRSQK